MVCFKIFYYCIRKNRAQLRYTSLTVAVDYTQKKFEMSTYKMDVKHFTATLSFSVYFFYKREYY
jgi:hypothetical protein